MRAGLPLEDAVRPIAVAGPGVARTIVQAHHDGLPLAPALRRLAAEMRTRRRDELLAAIRAIPARATVPLVLCVLPSFVLTAVVPLGLASFGAVRTPAA
jgi:pilus assembly protein TadC